FFFSSRRRHTRFSRDWSSDVCSSDLARALGLAAAMLALLALVPGFPPHVFLGIALVPGLAAYALWRRGQRLQDPAQQAEPAEPADRKSGVEGKRGDLGARRSRRKKEA